MIIKPCKYCGSPAITNNRLKWDFLPQGCLSNYTENKETGEWEEHPIDIPFHVTTVNDASDRPEVGCSRQCRWAAAERGPSWMDNLLGMGGAPLTMLQLIERWNKKN